MPFLLKDTRYQGGSTRIFSSVVFSVPDNQPPVFTSVDTLSLRQSETLNHTLTTTDNEGDTITYSLVNNSLSWVSIAGAVVTINPDLAVTTGNYQITARADDGTTLVDQVITITVNAAQVAFVAPIKRVVEWDEGQTPDLVLGDLFWHVVTLKAGVNSTAFDISNATSVNVAIVHQKHSKALSGTYTVDLGLEGSDLSNGVLSLQIPSSITDDPVINEETYAKIEIEVIILGNRFTWFAPVRLIQGFV